MSTERLKRFDPPPDDPALSDPECLELVGKTTWYHSFELRPGIVSPGQIAFDAVAVLDGLEVPGDLRGKRVLDIGAWDGPITFEMERRGADASALDIQDPTRVGFAVARRVMGSRAVHYQGSVYALPENELSELDHIVFRGVYYHLKHPLLAFERIAGALKMGGVLHFEGEGFLHYAETLGGEAVIGEHPKPRRFWERPTEDRSWLLKVAESDIPVCLSYPNHYKGASNWFVPNNACLRGWLEASGFEVLGINAWTDEGSGQRLYGTARKVRDSLEIEHPLY